MVCPRMSGLPRHLEEDTISWVRWIASSRAMSLVVQKNASTEKIYTAPMPQPNPKHIRPGPISSLLTRKADVETVQSSHATAVLREGVLLEY